MAIYIEFELKPTEVRCIYNGELDIEHWAAIKKSIEINTLVFNFVHEPTFYGFDIKSANIYSGKFEANITSDGLVSVSGKGLAKIDGSPKAVKDVHSENPEQIYFAGITSDLSDQFGGASLSIESEKTNANIKLYSKKV